MQGERLTESWNELRRLINVKNTNFFTREASESPMKQARRFVHTLADRHMNLVPIVPNDPR